MKKFLFSIIAVLAMVSLVPYASAVTKQFQVNTLSGGSLTTGLISYYKMEDATDYFSTNNLTNNNSVAFNAGKVNNAGDTGSTNTNKTLSIASTLGIDGGSMSIALWVNFTTVPTSVKTIGGQESNGGSNTGYTFEYDGTTLTCNRFKNGTSDNTATETVSLTAGTWYFLACTYDGTTLRLYRNNVAKGTLNTTGNGGAGTVGQFKLFDNPTCSNCRNISGKLDEVAVWNKALTTNEISDDYNGALGQTMCTVGVDCPSGGGGRHRPRGNLCIHSLQSRAFGHDPKDGLIHHEAINLSHHFVEKHPPPLRGNILRS